MREIVASYARVRVEITERLVLLRQQQQHACEQRVLEHVTEASSMEQVAIGEQVGNRGFVRRGSYVVRRRSWFVRPRRKAIHTTYDLRRTNHNRRRTSQVRGSSLDNS